MNTHFQPLKFTMTLSTRSVEQQISQETKHRDNISDYSRSISNNSNQTQEFNIQYIIVNSPNRNSQRSKQIIPS